MRTTPRNLTILRLNDDLLPASRENAPFGGIDVIRFNSDHQTELSAITSWRAALMFWSSFGSDRPPDLVVADVNFEKDSTTPLHPEDAPDTQIPTGLSHLKPIAALARALAQP